MSKQAEKKTLLFEINGFEVYSNSTYLIKDKKDGDAPTGFVNAGVSKLPSDGIDESFQCRFHPTSPDGKKGSWDTGFYEFSPCYIGVDQKRVKEIVASLRKNVLVPYQKFMGDENAMEHTNPESLKHTNFKVKSGRVFNTNHIPDVMELYFALRAHQVAPIGSQGDSKYRGASYIVVDTTKAVKDNEEKINSTFDAITLFSTVHTSDKDKLYAILYWMDMKPSESISKGTLSNLFFEVIKDSQQKCETFINLVAECEQPIGREKVFIHKYLKENFTKSPKITKQPNGMLFWEEHEIGADYKSAAENLAKSPGFADIKKEILSGLDY